VAPSMAKHMDAIAAEVDLRPRVSMFKQGDVVSAIRLGMIWRCADPTVLVLRAIRSPKSHSAGWFEGD